MGLYSCNLMEWGQYLYRNDNFLALLAAEPDQAHDILERLTRIPPEGTREVPRAGRTIRRRHQLQ